MELVQAALYLFLTVLFLVVVRLGYVWNTRIRPLQPSLDLEWAADCEHLTTATVEGTKITFHNVRDFKWRTTKDRDERWADEVVVDADDLVQIWFVVDHFHAIKGMAHTYLITVLSTIEKQFGIKSQEAAWMFSGTINLNFAQLLQFPPLFLFF